MNKAFVAFFGVLIVGVGVGYALGYDIGWERSLGAHTRMEEEMSMSHSMSTTLHTHERMEAGEPLPKIWLEVLPDPKSGYNAHITLEHFVFAPERASQGFVAGEGHAHIYVDGIKINRVYGEWYYLGTLAPGEHDITVRLSTNDHKELVHQGEPIEARAMVYVE